MKTHLSITGMLFRLVAAASVSLFYPFCAGGQQTVYISDGGSVFTYAGDTVSIFGDVVNAGRLGSSNGAVVNFLGGRWTNAPRSSLPGEEGDLTGGLFRFMGSRTQILESGYQINSYSGPSFPNLAIDNKAGVRLADLNDLRVRMDLYFSRGNLYLNGWSALVDGAIRGYSGEGFVVTGENIGGGRLYLDQGGDSSRYVFPIGTDDDSYTPLALQTGSTTGGRVAARVFNHVYENGLSGAPVDSYRVKKTWQLTAAQGIPRTTLFLQHAGTDETVPFAVLRDSSYISLYRPIEENWDTDRQKHSVGRPGNLTTATPLNDTYINDRYFPGGIPPESPDSISWFSVAAAYNTTACPVADFKLWAAQRQNYRWVQLFWRTLKEINVVTYELQRKRDTGSTFKTIETIGSKSNNGFSNHLIYYYYADDNQYDGWTSYRLKMTSAGGCVVYTDIQTVPWAIGVDIWPNPSPGATHVHIKGVRHKVILQVVNTWGQVLQQHTLNYDGIINLDHLPDAVYFIVIRDPKRDNKKVTTVKLVVQHTR